MNLRDLEYVAAVDRYRNFGRAAEACNVSQPALSAQVKKLEERLGVELFARTKHGTLTTDAGVRIVATAKDVLLSAKRITDTAAEYHDPMAAPLRVGIIPTLAPFIVPYLTGSIKSISDDLKAIYREQPTQTLRSELENRTIDLALLSGPVEVPGFKFTPVFSEPLLLVVAKRHRLANTGHIPASDIPIEELLLLTDEHCLRGHTTALCQDKNIGIDVPDTVLATNLLTTSHYVAQGIGCSLMPVLAKSYLEPVNPDIRFVQIDDKSYQREIGFLSRDGCPREHILMALCNQIRSTPPEGGTPLA